MNRLLIRHLTVTLTLIAGCLAAGCLADFPRRGSLDGSENPSPTQPEPVPIFLVESTPTQTPVLPTPLPSPTQAAQETPAFHPYTPRPTPEDDPARESLTRHEPAGCPEGCRTHLPGCDIKGNISYTSGNKIYHLPGSEFYEKTVINPDYGERWFCTEDEAIANGWRPPRPYR